MNTMCQWTFTYQPEGEEDQGPLGFRYVSFAEDEVDARTCGYLHWIFTMLQNGYDVPGVRIRD